MSSHVWQVVYQMIREVERQTPRTMRKCLYSDTLIVAMFVLPRRLRHDDEWVDLAGWSRWMGSASAALMVLYLVSSESDGFP